MANEESRRSVTPNGDLIDSLRKEKGWTLETFAFESNLGMRTVQKVIVSHPVSIETLQVIAKKLGVPYESLLAGKAHPVAQTAAVKPTILQLSINLGSGATDAAKIAEVIAFLQKLLPDNGSLSILAVAGGSLVIGVNSSTANEVALRDEKTRKAMNEFGFRSYVPNSEGQSPYVRGNFMGGHPLRPDLLDAAHSVHYYNQARNKYATAGHDQTWEELSISQQRNHLIEYMRALANDLWRMHSTELQPFLAKTGMSLGPANYDAMYKSLWNNMADGSPKEHASYHDYDEGEYQKQISRLRLCMRFIVFLDGAHKLSQLSGTS